MVVVVAKLLARQTGGSHLEWVAPAAERVQAAGELQASCRPQTQGTQGGQSGRLVRRRSSVAAVRLLLLSHGRRYLGALTPRLIALMVALVIVLGGLAVVLAVVRAASGGRRGGRGRGRERRLNSRLLL